MDIFDKVTRYDRADEARRQGTYPYFQPLQRSEGATARFEGRDMIMLGSNNYLGLTMHPAVRKAAAEAVAAQGTSCTGSRFLNGTLELHIELERRLAQFHGAEACQTFTTGYQANVGVLSALVGKGDWVILDKDDHASIVDGCLLATALGGQMLRFRHSDLTSLQAALAKCPAGAGKLVVVDGVYSMSGELAPLPDIIALCREAGARVLVDDAHAVGTIGPGGRGTAAHFGLEAEVDLVTGTFSKSLASVGGYVYGKAGVVDYIRHHARSLVFSASIPPSSAAAALAALGVLESDPTLVKRLQGLSGYWRRGLAGLGLPVGNGLSPVVPVALGSEQLTLTVWRGLLARGVYTNPVVPPAVPEAHSLLRTSCMATHTEAQLAEALEALGQVLVSCGQSPGVSTRSAARRSPSLP